MALIGWQGERIVRRLVAAEIEAVDRVNERASEIARTQHEWVSETGELEASIEKGQTRVEGGDVVGEFKSTSDHWVFLEFGTVKMRARPFLRPAQDEAVRELGPGIRKSFKVA